MKIPIKYIIELGLIRKRNLCASCNIRMDIKNYNIQLCKTCREGLIDMDLFNDKLIDEEKDKETLRGLMEK